MRDVALIAGLLGLLGFSFRYPFGAALVWGWLGFMAPNDLVFGIARTLPLSMIAALETMVLAFISKDIRRWPRDALPAIMIIYVLWTTFNTFFAPDQEDSWRHWAEAVKTYVFIMACLMLFSSKARIHAMIWIYVMSIGFFSLKGGIFTIIHAGAYHVYGPPNTEIEDNNQLALAVVMTLPLLYYLWLQTANKWIRRGILLTFPLQIATILGSYSRGGLIALAVTLAFFWARARNRLRNLLVLAAVGVAALSVMPPSFWERMDTIQSAGQDESFRGRVTAWQVAFFYARDHFPLGFGFYGGQHAPVYHHYFPGASIHAAHSIYFEALGDQGFPGLALFLLMGVLCMNNLRVAIRQSRGRPEVAWAYDLARMTQVGLVGFYVGGAALSMAYYDGFILLQAISSVLRQMTKPQTVAIESEAVTTEGEVEFSHHEPELS